MYSQLQEENQSCILQSLSTFYYRLTLLNDAMIPQRGVWNRRCQSQVWAAVLLLLKSHRQDETCGCLLKAIREIFLGLT